MGASRQLDRRFGNDVGIGTPVQFLGSRVLDGALPSQEVPGVLSRQDLAPTNEGVNQSRAEIG